MRDATIRDVARRAQVSVASVSRALNNLDNVSEKTRARVADAVKELGYVPHAGARSLSLARTNAIGVVLPDLYGEFFSEIVRGMDREASRRGYLLLLSNMHAGHPQSESAVRAMRGRVDGLIMMAPHLSDAEVAEALPAGMPAVLVNTHSDAHAGIRLDNAAGAKAVAQHFLATGRKRIVHIAGHVGNIDAEERAEAFSKAIEGTSARLQTLQGDFSEESGVVAIETLLAKGATFDAVFAANDMMASGVLQALRKAGLRVPEEVAVAGFDDIPLASHLGLTTVRVRIAELGERALDRLFDMLDSNTDSAGRELHAPELVVRDTTASE
ncbi:LacI family transcriptional regulator [Sphingomonas sp. SM33]|uniref:LacI family transcriptional regulator n=1 Tax=Sphingomonas telluris TaxID=2907998 RepID=A0ABS9VMD3_9SPHN|nr:LacI family DNA-binding transcriptional regulator [Sphingomonas telluris]MCH8616121.1 LacI family transcriptional regulator [Sphingomonas telluris]